MTQSIPREDISSQVDCASVRVLSLEFSPAAVVHVWDVRKVSSIDASLDVAWLPEAPVCRVLRYVLLVSSSVWLDADPQDILRGIPSSDRRLHLLMVEFQKFCSENKGMCWHRN